MSTRVAFLLIEFSRMPYVCVSEQIQYVEKHDVMIV